MTREMVNTLAGARISTGPLDVPMIVPEASYGNMTARLFSGESPLAQTNDSDVLAAVIVHYRLCRPIHSTDWP